jgi:hypothetical protein
MQDDHVVACSSRRLRKHEEHYPMPDLELATVVCTLKIWRCYLMEKICELYMDHKSLKYIFTRLDLNLRPTRRLELVRIMILESNTTLGKQMW